MYIYTHRRASWSNEVCSSAHVHPNSASPNRDRAQTTNADIYKYSIEIIYIFEEEKHEKVVHVCMYLGTVLAHHIRGRRRITFRRCARMNTCACQQRASAQQHDSKVPKWETGPALSSINKTIFNWRTLTSVCPQVSF